MDKNQSIGDEHAALAGFEQGPGLAAVFAGPDNVVVAVNAAGRAVAGDRALVGRPAREALAELTGQQLIERLDEVYRTGRPFRAHEVRIQVADPATAAVREVFVDLALAPWRDEAGHVLGVLGFGLDVTALVLAHRSRLGDPAERTQPLGGVTAVQRALLPTDLPLLPGVQLAARYLLGETDAAAGGDWFDALPLAGGRVALVVGDVVGHGVAASAVMGQLRTVLRDRLAGGADLPAAVRGVEEFVARLPAARGATLCVAVLEVATGALCYCTAGHPPPLLVSADGVGRFLPISGSGPLGTGSPVRLAEATLAEGEVLLLYSDGIVERPGRDPQHGTVELAQVAADAAMNRVLPKGAPLEAAERVCQQTVEVLTRGTGYRDDLTLLAAQRVTPPPVLELDLRAEPAAVRRVRTELDHWLFTVGAGAEDVLAVQHAVGEVVTNVVEHAYAVDDPQRTVSVRVVHESTGQLCVRVADRGRWRAADPHPVRGRGLAMASAFVDEVRIDRHDQGTTVEIRHRLARPVQLLTTAAAPRASCPTDVPYAATLRLTPSVQLNVTGSVDGDTAPLLRAELARISRGGTASVVVDLAGVTHLASAGVQVLYEFAGTIQLVAPPGSVAQHVLATVGLPYD